MSLIDEIKKELDSKTFSTTHPLLEKIKSLPDTNLIELINEGFTKLSGNHLMCILHLFKKTHLRTTQGFYSALISSAQQKAGAFAASANEINWRYYLNYIRWLHLCISTNKKKNIGLTAFIKQAYILAHSDRVKSELITFLPLCSIDEAVSLISSVSSSKSWEQIESLCHVLLFRYVWKKNMRRALLTAKESFNKQLVESLERDVSPLYRYSVVTAYLASIENGKGIACLRKALSDAHSLTQFQHLARYLHRFDDTTLTEYFNTIQRKNISGIEQIVVASCAKDPELFNRLSRISPEHYLYTISMTDTPFDPDFKNKLADFKRKDLLKQAGFKRMIKSSSMIIRKELNRPSGPIPPTPPTNFRTRPDKLSLYAELYDIVDPVLPGISASGGSESGEVTPGYAIGALHGDAMYKNIDYPGIGNHFHAGLYTGVQTYIDANGNPVLVLGTAEITKSDTLIWDCAQNRETNYKFRFLKDNINDDIKIIMMSLREDLIGFFAGNDGFQGFRQHKTCPANVTRDAIVATGQGFPGHGIDWWMADMISAITIVKFEPKWWWIFTGPIPTIETIWNGRVSDIENCRCDGLVEFSYEKNGLRVCGGKGDGSRWNITSPGLTYLDSHENFHNINQCDLSTYDHGELCPRIQANVIGGDSEFVKSPEEFPVFKVYWVQQGYFSDPGAERLPVIHCTVESRFCETVYYRMRVRKVGESSFHIVKSENVQESNFHSGHLGMTRLPKNIFLLWLGKTEDGKDYNGDNGKYEFRFEAIDKGGNSSPTCFFKTDITW